MNLALRALVSGLADFANVCTALVLGFPPPENASRRTEFVKLKSRNRFHWHGPAELVEGSVVRDG